MSESPRHCAILRFSKLGMTKYVGHLDFARAFDRALRRAQVPVAYTQGFNEHARVSFSPPLPVGAESTAELCAVELAELVDAAQIKDRLNEQLPQGVRVLQARIIQRKRRSPLADISRGEYEATLEAEDVEIADIHRAVQAIKEADAIPMQRKSKRGERTVDIRAGIHELSIEDREPPVLQMTLGMGEGDTARPSEVIKAINARLGEQGEVCIAGLKRVALA